MKRNSKNRPSLSNESNAAVLSKIRGILLAAQGNHLISSIGDLQDKTQSKGRGGACCVRCQLVLCTCILSDSQEKLSAAIFTEALGRLKLLAPTQENNFSKPVRRRTEAAEVYLLRGVYASSPATILFDYPPQCNLPSRSNTARTTLVSPESIQLSFKISDSVNTYNSLVNALKYAGFRKSTTGRSNVLITIVPKTDIVGNLLSHQKINHFPGSWQLGRKDSLWKNVSRLKREHKQHYSICPKTFILPDDFSSFNLERQSNPDNLWIMKPNGLSCGKGIKLLSNKTAVENRNGYIISKYINNPHLINSFKYDLRLYVCVTSFDPLRVYLYDDGLVRFATVPYVQDKKSIKYLFMHLTNFSVNKRSPNFVKNETAEEDGQGSKWSFKALLAYFASQGLSTEQILNRITDTIVKSLISVESHIVNQFIHMPKKNSNCFELYGFDIMLDEDLRPWLLEVNISPSLSSSSPLDKKLKTTLMCDVFNLVGITSSDKKQTKTDRGRPKSGVDALNSAKIEQGDIEVLLESFEEDYRRGNFTRIFPVMNSIDYYSKFFINPRHNNLLLWKFVKGGSKSLDYYSTRLHRAVNI